MKIQVMYYRTDHVVVYFRQLHDRLVRFILRKGPVDVALGILRGVEGLGVGLIKREVLLQPVWQVGLEYLISEEREKRLREKD